MVAVELMQHLKLHCQAVRRLYTVFTFRSHLAGCRVAGQHGIHMRPPLTCTWCAGGAPWEGNGKAHQIEFAASWHQRYYGVTSILRCDISNAVATWLWHCCYVCFVPQTDRQTLDDKHGWLYANVMYCTTIASTALHDKLRPRYTGAATLYQWLSFWLLKSVIYELHKSSDCADSRSISSWKYDGSRLQLSHSF